MANGRKFAFWRSEPDGRESQLTTDRDIQTGPAPSKIVRLLNENNRGLVDDGNYNFINPMDKITLPFLKLSQVRRVQIPSRAGIPAFSETVQVKTFSIGDNQAYKV